LAGGVPEGEFDVDVVDKDVMDVVLEDCGLAGMQVSKVVVVGGLSA